MILAYNKEHLKKIQKFDLSYLLDLFSCNNLAPSTKIKNTCYSFENNGSPNFKLIWHSSLHLYVF